MGRGSSRGRERAALRGGTQGSYHVIIECSGASRTEGDRSVYEVKKVETGVSWTGETAPMFSDVDGTLKPATPLSQ